jgi:hypothetical protein
MREATVRFVMRILGMLATGNVRGLITLVLGLALVGGLWETSLYNLSSRETATAAMTEVGVELVNPLLVNNSLGLNNTLYGALQAQAKANPSQQLSIPGLKVQVTGRDIAGKSFTEGSRVIYTKVAARYYDGGWTAVLAAPDSVTRGLGALALLPQAVASQGAKQVGAPQLPSVPLPPLGAVGLSLQTFTAAGHAQVLALDKWLVGIALLCLLLLAVASKRWQRLTAPAWALVTGALPGAFGIGVIAFFWARNAALFQPFSGLLHALAGAFVPVYLGAMALGVAALVVAWIGDVATHAADMRQAAATRERAQVERQAAFHAPAPKYRPPATASGAQGYGDWGYQERRPIGAPDAGGFTGASPRAGASPYAQGRPAAAPSNAWQSTPPGVGWQPPSPTYGGPTWDLAPRTPSQPNLQGQGWAPPGMPRPPYSGPNWANDPAGPQLPPALPDDPWSSGPQGGEWPGAPAWGAPPGPAGRSPYSPPGPQRPGVGIPQPPSRWPEPRDQGARPDDADWGTGADDDPWAPRGR